MNKTEFLERVRAARQELNEAISGLSADELTQEGAVGGWSVKDVLAHITAWQGEATLAVERVARGVFARAAHATPDGRDLAREPRARGLGRVSVPISVPVFLLARGPQGYDLRARRLYRLRGIIWQHGIPLSPVLGCAA